jgi:hypothetical protein
VKAGMGPFVVVLFFDKIELSESFPFLFKEVLVFFSLVAFAMHPVFRVLV